MNEQVTDVLTTLNELTTELNRNYIFNFLKNPTIPSNNNASERGIRKLKIKQIISGTFRSDNGADAFMALHSLTDTAWKNNQSPLDAILALY